MDVIGREEKKGVSKCRGVFRMVGVVGGGGEMEEGEMNGGKEGMGQGGRGKAGRDKVRWARGGGGGGRVSVVMVG